MKADPFFSIVVPTFNRVEKLIPAIDSILSQSFTDFELIIVDDGSTDGTPMIVGEKFKDGRIRVIPQPNSERGSARNNGFRNARGKYVLFFDSDDLMHGNHLQVLNKCITEEGPDFVATKFDFVDENGKHRHSDMQPLRQGYYDHRLFLNGNPLACNVCVRRDLSPLILFEEDRKYAIKEDWMFLISNMKRHKLFIVDETTISMLDHEERSMRSDNAAIIRKTMLAMEWIVRKVELNQTEIRQLMAHVNYFCGIHAYLENNRKESIMHSANAMRFGGFKLKYLLLLIKSLIGRKIITTFR